MDSSAVTQDPILIRLERIERLLQSQRRPERLLRRREVARMTGLSPSTIYAMIERGEFPAPIRVGQRMSAWAESDVQAWIEQTVRAAKGQGAV